MFYNLEAIVDVTQNNNYNSNHLMLKDNKCIVDLKLHLNIDYDPERDKDCLSAMQPNRLYEVLVTVGFATEAWYEIASFVFDTNKLSTTLTKEHIGIAVPDTAEYIDFIVLIRNNINNVSNTWTQQITKRFNI
jgi:hypothetical protein